MIERRLNRCSGRNFDDTLIVTALGVRAKPHWNDINVDEQAMSGKKHKSVEVKLKVPFHDLDPAKIVWHGNYLKYFDIARFALFRDSGVDLYDYFMGKEYAFPVIKTSTKHIVPLRHGDVFICKATVIEARIKISIDFEIRLADSGVVCTRGRGDQVAVKMPEMELQLEIPAEVSRALGFE